MFSYIVDKNNFNNIDYEEYKINPNTYLEISRLNRKFLIKFTQIYLDSEADSHLEENREHIGCTLELFLQYKNDKVHLIEEAYKNY